MTTVPVAKRSAHRLRKRTQGRPATHRLYVPFPADRKERRQFANLTRAYFNNEAEARKWDVAQVTAALRGLIFRVLHSAAQQPMTDDGQLVPVLEKPFGTLVNNYRRMIELLESMDAEVDASKIPDLGAYLASHANAHEIAPEPARPTITDSADIRAANSYGDAVDVPSAPHGSTDGTAPALEDQEQPDPPEDAA